MTIMSVPLGKLQVSPLNVRTNEEDAGSTAALEASIIAHGLLEPMIAHPLAKPKGSYGVYAGGRRLRALKNLEARGALPADFAAEIVVRDLTDAQITEASTAENLLRRDLRPYEIYAAFRNAVDRGVKPEDLALHFGQRQIYVDQVLRLGRLHPTIFTELAAGRLTNDQARAYAATEDQALQIVIYDRLSKSRSSYDHGPHQIRHAMNVGDQDSARLLQFVGRKTYEAAGGRWERDLFEEAEDRGRIVDQEILTRLVEEKLGALRAEMTERANRPFTFVDKGPTTGGAYGYEDHELKIDLRRSPVDDHQRQRKEALAAWKAEIEQEAAELLLDAEGIRKPGLEAEEAELDQRYDAIVEELDQIERSRRFLLPKNGDIVATLKIERGGDHALQFWFASRKAKKEAAPGQSAAPIAEGAAVAGDYSATRAANALVKNQLGISSTGIAAVRALRRSILRALLIENAQRGGDVAQDYLVWSQLRGAIFSHFEIHSEEVGAFKISAGMSDSMADTVDAAPYLEQTRSQEVWNGAIDLLKQQSFVTSKNLGGSFIDFQHAKPELKALAAAVVAGLSLKRSMNADGYRIDVHDVVANATSRSYPEAVRELWSPTPEFINLLPKAKRLDEVRELVDGKTLTAWGKKKAADITDLVIKVMTGRSPSLKTSAVAAAKAWVHPLLQFGRPDVLEKAVTADDREAA
jgi:ParB family chromosome partitioning protein